MNIHCRKFFQLVLCLLMILSLFTGCAQDEDTEPTIPRFKFLRKKAEILTVAAVEEDFELLGSDRDRNTFYDFYCLKREVPLDEIVLLPGETDDVQWATYGKIHWMIRAGKICRIIARQFQRQEDALRLRNPHKNYG